MTTQTGPISDGDCVATCVASDVGEGDKVILVIERVEGTTGQDGPILSKATARSYAVSAAETVRKPSK